MRKKVFGKQLSRDKNERTALFKGLMSALVLNESIQTTEAKAKAIKGEIEKLVTRALRSSSGQARRLLGKGLTPLAIEKMLINIAPRFKERKGGYTRIIRLGKRFGDDAQVVMLEWVEKAQIIPVEEKPKEVKLEKEEKPVQKKTKKPVKRVIRKAKTVKKT